MEGKTNPSAVAEFHEPAEAEEGSHEAAEAVQAVVEALFVVLLRYHAEDDRD